jgi:hypothetical protein
MCTPPLSFTLHVLDLRLGVCHCIFACCDFFPLNDNHVRKQRGAEFLMCLAAINRIVEVVKKLV